MLGRKTALGEVYDNKALANYKFKHLNTGEICAQIKRSLGQLE